MIYARASERMLGHIVLIEQYYESVLLHKHNITLRCHPERSEAESKDLAQRVNYETYFERYQYSQKTIHIDIIHSRLKSQPGFAEVLRLRFASLRMTA